MFNTNLYGIKNGVSNFSTDVTFIVLFALFTLLTTLVAVWIINLSIKKKTEKIGSNQLFGIMLVVALVGIAVRLVLSYFITGHRMEYNAIAGENGAVWNIINEGFSGYYSGDGSIYPFSLYLFSMFATLGSWFGMTYSSAAAPFLIKLPLIIADIGCIVLLYKISKKYFNQVVAVAISGLFCLCPVFMLPSAVWGSLYAVLAFFMLLTFYFLVQKKFLFLFISYSFALLTAKEAIYFIPVLAVFVGYQFVKSLKLNKSERGKSSLSFSELFKHPDKGIVVRLPIYFIVCLIGMYIISLPFIINDYKANFFVWLNEFYIKGLTKMDFYTYNGLSLYSIFGMNGNMFGTNLVVLFIVLFLAIVVVLTLIYYLSKKNRANLVMLGAFIYMTLSLFFIDFSEMTIYPVLLLLLLSFIFIKDKRLLQVLALYAIIFVINASLVMAFGGYLNNLAENMFLPNNDYTGDALLTFNTAANVANIVLSVLALITYFYFTFILMDISMNHNRKLFGGQDKKSPLYAIKHWMK